MAVLTLARKVEQAMASDLVFRRVRRKAWRILGRMFAGGLSLLFFAPIYLILLVLLVITSPIWITKMLIFTYRWVGRRAEEVKSGARMNLKEPVLPPVKMVPRDGKRSRFQGQPQPLSAERSMIASLGSSPLGIASWNG